MSTGIVDEIVAFWFETLKPEDWYRKNAAVDAAITARFGATYDMLKTGVPPEWLAEPKGTLAAIIVLDQFPRNMFRDDARAFATDGAALALAKRAIGEGADMRLPPEQRAFIYLPFQHAETVEDQARSIELFAALGVPLNLDFALRHQAIIARFGRFPHRNSVLGRASRAEELAFLQEPGSSFRPPPLLDRDDRVAFEPVGVFAGVGDRFVARDARGRHVEHALGAVLAEFVALHGILEHHVPEGAAVPEIDLDGAARVAAQRIDAALAFQFRIIGNPVLAAVAVDVLHLEHGIGIGLALHVLAGACRFLERLGDVVRRLGCSGQGGRERSAEQAAHGENLAGNGLHCSPWLAVLRVFFFLRATFFAAGAALRAPQTLSPRWVGPLLSEA